MKASLGSCSLDVSKSWDAAQAARQKLQQQAPGAARQAKDEQEAAEAAAGPAQSEAAQVAAPALKQDDASAPAKPQEEPQKPPPTGANAEDEDMAKLLGMSEESFLQELELAIVAEDPPVINAEAEEDEEEETKPKATQEAPCGKGSTRSGSPISGSPISGSHTRGKGSPVWDEAQGSRVGKWLELGASLWGQSHGCGSPSCHRCHLQRLQR